MNSFSGNSSQKPSSSSPLKSYQFDFDLGLSGRSSSSRPLKDQKPIPSAAAAAPSWTPHASKPSWTHQPAPRSSATATAAAPTSMVGDIFGKSWGSPASAPSPASTARIGIPDKNPNLFGDLVGSALGKSGVGGNVPLKAAAAASAAPRSSYSMSNLSDNLPQSAATSTNAYPIKPNGNSAENLQNFASGSQSGIRNPMKGGQPVKSATAAGMNAKKDPFGSLLDFSSKPSGNPPLSSAKPAASGGNDPFGDFQKADFGKPARSIPAPPASSSNSSASASANFPFDGFGIPAQNFSSQEQTAQAKSGSDPIDMLFASSASSASAATASDINDWDVNVEFGGSGGGGEVTTELDGLPPPPVGVTASSAKNKGLDNYKQGQYPDAVKWLTWAVVLSEKSGDSSVIIELLTCRASCYKEIGEYKKAVADCSKAVLEHDGENVSVLLQRALLYENTEKYRLGAEDLRMVLKIDPGNRLARSTIHRLNKMAD